MESMMIYVPIVMALLGLAFMAAKRAWVLKQDAGDGKMKEISDYIYEGALAFLKAEYRLLAIFVLIASVVLAGITFRAAKALNLKDRGILKKGMKADFVVFETNNFQNILYNQGSLVASEVYIDGEKI